MPDIIPQDITGTSTTEPEQNTNAAPLTDIGEIPATQPAPDLPGTLSLRYQDGVPMLVVNGGNAVPETLVVVDGTGTAVAAYTAGPPPARARVRQLDILVPDYKIDDVIQSAP
jgi:hypothetical protein